MKTILLVVLVVLVIGGAIAAFVVRNTVGGGVQKANASTPPADGSPASLYAYQTNTLEGEPADLAQYRGKVALVVNVASKCGLTPQYEGLEKLYETYRDRGLVILGFPSNDFMGQEPGTPEEIRTFCSNTYGVSFPMFEKVVVKGEGKAPIYQFLTRELEEPTWNFTKYLVDRDGKVLYRFAPKTTPDDPELVGRIEEILGASS